MRIIGNRRAAFALLAGIALCGPAACVAAAAVVSPLALSSPALRRDAVFSLAYVYDRSGCHGGNRSPALRWSHSPAGTRSFAVLMFDPDAPGRGFWHWAVFDLPPGLRALPAGAGDPAGRLLPAGAIQARNDWGFRGYGGPCPPPGRPHRYRVMLYALGRARLGLGASPSAAEVAATVRADALAEAQIVGLYGR